MENLKDGALEILIADGERIQMSWLGRSENREPAAVLNPYLGKIVDAIAGKKLDVDFARLEYMNSSTVPPIIQMIKLLDTRGVETKIFYNKDSKWQAASFKALETISRMLNHVQVLGK
jgi:hypothetical protein